MRAHLLALACIAASAQSFAATPVLYHSAADDGVSSGVPALVPEGVAVVLHLYVDGGSVASPVGQACVSGPNDEICGWDFGLVGTGGLTFDGFVASGDVESNLGAAALRMNGGDPFVGTLGPSKVGDLEISGAAGEQVVLTRGDVVTSQLSRVQIAAGPIVTLPEPGGLVGLLPGLMWVHWLRRRRRAEPRAV